MPGWLINLIARCHFGCKLLYISNYSHYRHPRQRHFGESPMQAFTDRIFVRPIVFRHLRFTITANGQTLLIGISKVAPLQDGNARPSENKTPIPEMATRP